MKLQLLRNATLVLTINGKTILIDPMLAPKGSYEPFQFTSAQIQNPTVDLPLNNEQLTQLIAQTDAVLLTHTHLDHLDAVAQQLLPKDIALFCQPADIEKIKQAGFTNVKVIDDDLTWQGITIHRTDGQHGTGEIGQRMGIVSGYVINGAGKTLYIAGDTIWCDEVRQAIDDYKPQRIVVNGGGARFVMGDAL